MSDAAKTPVHCDVAVAGAGPAGAVAARVLARAGRRVVLVDPVLAEAAGAENPRRGHDPAREDSGPPRYKVGESLPGAARPLLRDLGLLERLEAGPHRPSHGTISAWGTDALRSADALRDPHGPGWHLDRLRFDADLRTAAAEAGVAFEPTFVRSLERVDGAWRLGCRAKGEEGEAGTGPTGAGEIIARRVIDATGRHAALARLLGVERHRDDRLVALCAWTGPGGTPDGRTLVEAVPDGWWYTAALPDGGRVVVLHGDAEEAAEILHTEGAWEERLAATTHVRRAVGEAEIVLGPRATEACGARLERFGGDGWLAVGDAALSFDPLSSQGLFDALYTGLRGAEATEAALAGNAAPAEAYAARLESIRAAYLRHHRVFYGAERRWTGRGFWRRRVATKK